MAATSLVVIDGFYDDPDEIRALALSLEFKRRPGANYPGREAVAGNSDWTLAWKKLRSYIDEPCDAPCPKPVPFPQGKFRLALAADQQSRTDLAHIDQQRWSGVVYLTKAEDCRGGLALYRQKATGSVYWNDEWFMTHYTHLYLLEPEEFRKGVLDFYRDPMQFEQIGLIPMAYNRAIVLMAQVFHGTGIAFGTEPANGRLTQHFEFYQ